MAIEAAEEFYKGRHEKLPYHDGTFTSWAEKQSLQHPFPANAGVTIGVTDEDLAPWDAFTTMRDASPFPPDADAESADPDPES